jgi:hypothetical protein
MDMPLVPSGRDVVVMTYMPPQSWCVMDVIRKGGRRTGDIGAPVIASTGPGS